MANFYETIANCQSFSLFSLSASQSISQSASQSIYIMQLILQSYQLSNQSVNILA